MVKEYSADFSIIGSDIDANVIKQAKSTYPDIEFDIMDIGIPLPNKWIMKDSKRLVKIKTDYL